MLTTVQGLRAVATFLVAFAHTDQVTNHRDHVRIGESIVVLFFVLSGFVMVYKTQRETTKPLSFMRDRLRRCVPLYWALTLVVFLIALLSPALTQATRADPVELIKSLLFIPFVKSNGLVQPVLYVGWTLNYEMFFYALFAVGLLVRNRVLSAVLTILAMSALAIIGQFLPADWTIARFYTSPQLWAFVFGMLTGLQFAWRKATAFHPHRLVGELMVAVGLVALVFVPILFPESPEALTCGVPAVVALNGGLWLEGKGSWLSAAWLNRLGDASYSIYLGHTFVLEAFTRASARFGVQGISLALVQVTCLFAIAAVGLFLRRYLERPLGRLAARAMPERRPRQPATA